MRRIASSGLVGLGAFLIVAAALIKFYAYPTLATVPTNYESTTMLEAKDAEIFDAATLKPIIVDLSIESFTVADSQVDVDDTAVWQTRTSITRDDVEGAACPQVPDPDNTAAGCFQQSTERGAFDPETGAAISNEECEECDSSISISSAATGDGDDVTAAVDRSGQWLKFPFDTEKKDYLQWDASTGKAWPAVYEGEEDLQGLTVYKFVQTIPETVLEETRDVPGSIFGVEDATVTANYVYSMTRTFYIEPVTGAPVNRIEERTQEFEYDGARVAAFNGTVGYTADQVKDSVDAAKSKSFQLGGMQLLFPLIALLLGLIAIAGGILLGRGGSNDEGSSTDHRQLVNA